MPTSRNLQSLLPVKQHVACFFLWPIVCPLRVSRLSQPRKAPSRRGGSSKRSAPPRRLSPHGVTATKGASAGEAAPRQSGTCSAQAALAPLTFAWRNPATGGNGCARHRCAHAGAVRTHVSKSLLWSVCNLCFVISVVNPLTWLPLGALRFCDGFVVSFTAKDNLTLAMVPKLQLRAERKWARRLQFHAFFVEASRLQAIHVLKVAVRHAP